MKRYTIDPKDFTEGQWVEIYNASTIMPRTYERKLEAKPFKRPRKHIELAIMCLVNKADYVLEGGFGPENHAGENEEWAEELRQAAGSLRQVIGQRHVSRKEAQARLRDLLTQDIYTDAPEYADRVSEIYDLLPLALPYTRTPRVAA